MPALPVATVIQSKPYDPDHKVNSTEMVELLEEIQAQSLFNGGLYFVDTKAQMDALSATEGANVFVQDDPTTANNGIWRYDGSAWGLTSVWPSIYPDISAVLARKWATEAMDVVVADAEYSALHHAAKALAAKNAISGPLISVPAYALGNLFGRGAFEVGEAYPFDIAIANGHASVAAVTGHPNGAITALRQIERTIYGDTWIPSGDIRGRRFHVRAVLDNSANANEVRIGIVARPADGSNVLNFVEVAAAPGEAVKEFEASFVIPLGVAAIKDFSVVLRNAGTEGAVLTPVDWSSLWMEDTTNNPDMTVSTDSPSGGVDGDLWFRVDP